MGMVIQSYPYHSLWLQERALVAEARGCQVQGQPGLQRLYFKKKKKKKSKHHMGPNSVPVIQDRAQPEEQPEA
jgi:predicted RNA-binding protein